MPGTVLASYWEKSHLVAFFLCIFSYNVETILNGGVDMKKKVVKLMEREGFILFLFICVCVVAGGTLFLSMRNLNLAENKQMNEDLVILEGKGLEDLSLYELDPKENYISSEKEVEEDLTVVSMNEEDVYVGEDSLGEADLEEIEFVEEEEDLEVLKEVVDTVKWILPIEGPIITEFTHDSLIYSDTLESWVGHKAIDIGAKEGTTVVASMDGVVKEVYEDELWGIVIVIDHGNDLKTRYANLATKEMVKVGVNVRKGDHISKVGKTAKIEMLMEPHLHFEVIKNEEIVDPRSIND